MVGNLLAVKDRYGGIEEAEIDVCTFFDEFQCKEAGRSRRRRRARG